MTVAESSEATYSRIPELWNSECDVDGVVTQICDRILAADAMEVQLDSLDSMKRARVVKDLSQAVANAVVQRLALLRSPFKYVVFATVFFAPEGSTKDGIPSMQCSAGHVSSLDTSTDGVVNVVWRKQKHSEPAPGVVHIPAVSRLQCIVQVLGASAIPSTGS